MAQSGRAMLSPLGALHGEYVSHIALKDACQVLRLCYRTERAAATATAQAIAA